MANRPLVYITRRIPQKGVDILLQDCDVKHWDSEETAPRGELLYCVTGTDAILCMPGDLIDARVINAAGPQLKAVATISESTDHIDYNECMTRGIKVITCPLQWAQNLADLTVALVLLTIKNSVTDEERRSLCKSLSVSKDGHFENSFQNGCKEVTSRPSLMRQMSEEQMAFQYHNGKPGNTNCLTWRGIAEKTFGIYGLTQTGTNVAKLLKNLGICNVLLADVGAPYVEIMSNGTSSNELEVFESESSKEAVNFEMVSFEQLLSRCDIILVCGSVGPESDSIFTLESFSKMKRSAILIVSQSEELAVDYLALYEALRDGHIKAAGLNDCNQVACPLKTMFQGLKNCVFLPQTSESVHDTRHQASVLVAKNLISAIKSKSLSNNLPNGHDL